ncbi:MAG: Crp/Fnr family transcriptional regulator [Candidatus Neomarinimicrobiota bacterium]
MGFLEQQLKRQYKPGEVIFKDGDPGQTMFIILEGQIEISKVLGDHKTVLAILDKGSIFGEMAIIDREPRSATAITVSDTMMLEMSREMFHDRLSKVPPWMQSFFAILVDRLRQATRKQSVLLTQGAGRQILNVLAMIAQGSKRDTKDRIVLPIPETVAQISFVLGLEDAVVNARIRHFVDNKICDVARKLDVGRVLVIEFPEKLFQLAQFTKERFMIEDGSTKSMSAEFRFKSRHEVELLHIFEALVKDENVPDDIPGNKLAELVKEKYDSAIAVYQPVLDEYVHLGILEKFQPKDGAPSYMINNKEMFQEKLLKIDLIKGLRELEKKITVESSD